MRGRGALGLLLACALMCGAPAAAWAGAGPSVAGSVQSATDLSAVISVAVSGHYAYTTAYDAGELTAVDISNPAAPAIAGHSSPFLDANLIGGSNVAISGGYAFVVSKNRNASSTSNDDGNGNSLTILDIHTDPANPSIVGTVRDTGKLFGSYGIAVSGHYAYVAYQGVLNGQPTGPDSSTGGFSVIDFSTPGNPTIVANIDNGALPLPWTGQNLFEHSTSVAVSGNYAYVTAFYSNRFTTINISDPTHPQIVGSIRDNANLDFPVDVAVQGSYAYVANQVGGSSPELTVLDISNPAAPTVVGTPLSNAALNGAYRIRVRGEFAYVSGSSADTISAVDISQPTAPRLAGFVYDLNHLNRTTGLDLDPTGAYVVASSPYLSTESNTTYPPYPLQSGGLKATGTISVIALDPNPIAVTIASGSEPANPTAATSANFTFSVNDSVSAVQCSLDGAAYGPCTSPTTQQYASLGSGCHMFAVHATSSAGITSTASYTWAIDLGTFSPESCVAPSIAGGAAVGQPLTASQGSWAGGPAPTVASQWEQCDASGAACSPISGATGSTYMPQRQDLGDTIRVVVTATNGSGSTAAASAATAPVTGAPVTTARPSISGPAVAGQTLSASAGGWSAYPAPGYAFQWQQCNAVGSGCAPIAGATGASYTATRSDGGHTLAVVVNASNPSGSGTALSPATAVVAAAPESTASPSFSGRALVGQRLQAHNGTWSGYPAPALSDTWLRCSPSGAACAAIAGATASTYRVSGADVGHTIRVAVHASNSAGSATSDSPASAVVPPGVSGSLTGVASGTPRLKLALIGGGQGVALSQISLSLPARLTFAGQRAVLRALSVHDGAGHRVAYKAALRGGALVISLHKPTGALTLVLASSGLHVSSLLKSNVRRHRISQLSLPLVVKTRGGQVTHETAAIRPT